MNPPPGYTWADELYTLLVAIVLVSAIVSFIKTIARRRL